MKKHIRETLYICGVLILQLGLLAWVGWIFKQGEISSFGTHFIPMAPLTATLFLILGPHLLLQRNPFHNTVEYVYRVGSSASIVLLSVTLLGKFFSRTTIGLEEWMVRQPTAFGNVLTGRISPLTSSFFFVCSIALLLLSFKNTSVRLRSAAALSALCIFFADGVILLGYIYKAPLLYGGTIIPMALPTALGFLFLSMGIVAMTGTKAFPLSYMVGHSARAILLRTFLPFSYFSVAIYGFFYNIFSPFTWNPALLAALAGLTTGIGMVALILRAAMRVGGRIDLAELHQKEAQTALKEAHIELIHAYDKTLEGWSHALELRDFDTKNHCQRVVELSAQLAKALGIPEEQLAHIRRGAFLHDIGKMGIPDSVLKKNGPLTDEERSIMQRHPDYAYQLLSPIVYLHPALEIPYCHHERWDGTGYPRGLKGEEIPLAARLFSVVDIWDALVSSRVYKVGWPEKQVLEYIQSISGTQLDPHIVEVFLKLQSSRSSTEVKLAA